MKYVTIALYFYTLGLYAFESYFQFVYPKVLDLNVHLYVKLI